MKQLHSAFVFWMRLEVSDLLLQAMLPSDSSFPSQFGGFAIGFRQ
jgi:hypothetical protein